jgi:hypothetical protein
LRAEAALDKEAEVAAEERAMEGGEKEGPEVIVLHKGTGPETVPQSETQTVESE